uniref:C-factor n=1 Tax=Phasianus colchicus TaxID=9054 RepID=A0A669R073_PHACC
MEGLSARSVLVTGCDGGMGLGLLKRFLELPTPPQWLFAACTDPDGKVSTGGSPRWGQRAPQHVPMSHTDVTDPSSIQAAVGRVQKELRGSGLNLLINSTGARRRSTLATETAENMALIYATNTIGPLQTSQAFMALLKEAAEAQSGQGLSCGRAAIINISSILGSIEVVEAWGERQDVSYRCSKAALNMLTKCLALEYGDSGILCVSVDPGCVVPPPGDGMVSGGADVEATTSVLQVLANLSTNNNGTFWDWKGRRLPW